MAGCAARAGSTMRWRWCASSSSTKSPRGSWTRGCWRRSMRSATTGTCRRSCARRTANAKAHNRRLRDQIRVLERRLAELLRHQVADELGVCTERPDELRRQVQDAPGADLRANRITGRRTRGTRRRPRDQPRTARRTQPAGTLSQCVPASLLGWPTMPVMPQDRGGSGALYDEVGRTYSGARRTEPRIAQRIWQALGDVRTVLNVGAGTGSYEPRAREVTAVEPSAVMRAQRPPDAAPCIAATAEELPFADCFLRCRDGDPLRPSLARPDRRTARNGARRAARHHLSVG